jgi:hypothetical protein
MNPIETLKELIKFPTYQVTLDKVEEGMKDQVNGKMLSLPR